MSCQIIKPHYQNNKKGDGGIQKKKIIINKPNFLSFLYLLDNMVSLI